MAYEDAQSPDSSNRTAFRAAEKKYQLQRDQRCIRALSGSPSPRPPSWPRTAAPSNGVSLTRLDMHQLQWDPSKRCDAACAGPRMGRRSSCLLLRRRQTSCVMCWTSGLTQPAHWSQMPALCHLMASATARRGRASTSTRWPPIQVIHSQSSTPEQYCTEWTPASLQQRRRS